MNFSLKDLFTTNVNNKSKKNTEETKNFVHRNTKKKISIQNDDFEKGICKKLNEGIILNYIIKSEKKESSKTAFSETPSNMNYELSMINKYNEDIDNNLSFISEFDLEEENNNDSSFNSSDDENNVEEIVISKTSKKIKLFDKEKEEDDPKLEKEWNDIVKLLSHKEN